MKFAGFWIRFIANLIDWAVLSAVSWVVEWVAGLVINPDGMALQILMVGFYGALSIVYYTYAHYRWGWTLGKWPFGIKVVSYENPSTGAYAEITLRQSLIRTFAYALSWLPFGCGFLMALFNKQKVALHDLFAGTVSIRVSGESPAEVKKA